MKRWATRLHAWVYRRSGGRVLGLIGGQPVLLLQTTGRRSGRTRTTPVQYVAHAEGFVVVAANHGARHPPAWYLTSAPKQGVAFGSGTRTSMWRRGRSPGTSVRSSGAN
jgi:F420H(2)-dependent quinone reductase